MLRLTKQSSYTVYILHALYTTFVHSFLQLQSFLWSLVVWVVWVELVGMVIQVSFGRNARVALLMSLVPRVVRVTLVGMVVQVSFSGNARVSSTARHDDQIMAARAIVQ